jgi:predicted DNA-binding transcriptional regulator YafY
MSLKLLETALNDKCPVEIIYEDDKGNLTHRTIRVRNIVAGLVVAFCYYRRENRTFKLEGILSAEYSRPTFTPKYKKERREWA